MAIQQLNSFFKNPDLIESFAQITSLTSTVGKNQMVLRSTIVEHFFAILPRIFGKLNQKGAHLDDKSWERFDSAFSKIATSLGKKQDSLKTIFQIESLTKRRFKTLDPSFVPILLKGPENRQAIVSKASLNSSVFQKMVSGHFEESATHIIKLEKLSPDSFDTIVAILKGEPTVIAEHIFMELFEFAYAYGFANLFIETCHQLFTTLGEKGFQNSEGAKLGYIWLCSLLGIEVPDHISMYTVFWITESIKTKDFIPCEKNTLRDLEVLYSQLCPRDSACQIQFADCICTLAKTIADNSREDDLDYDLWLCQWAANHGCRDGQFQLAVWSFYGDGQPRDFPRAHHYFKLAAWQGHAKAQFRVASFYLEKGPSFNPGEAFAWFKMAAAQKYYPAVIVLKAFYEYGVGVQKDPVKAEAIKREEEKLFFNLVEGKTQDVIEESAKMTLRYDKWYESEAISLVATIHKMGETDWNPMDLSFM